MGLKFSKFNALSKLFSVINDYSLIRRYAVLAVISVAVSQEVKKSKRRMSRSLAIGVYILIKI